MPENNLFTIKKRVVAANQTRKITRTMEMIASSRMQRVKLLLAHHYVWMKHMQKAAGCLSEHYFEQVRTRDGAQKAYIVFGGSKGLSGTYSSSVFQYAVPIVAGHLVLAVGNAAEAFFTDNHCYLGNDAPSADCAKSIAKAALALYEDNQAASVHMIYAKGNRIITQQLLPLTRPDEDRPAVIIAEPSEQALHPALYMEYICALVHEAHLQTFLAEQVARISAMDSATQNADEIIENLQATYNRIRQSSITQEIITVSNAARGER